MLEDWINNGINKPFEGPLHGPTDRDPFSTNHFLPQYYINRDTEDTSEVNSLWDSAIDSDSLWGFGSEDWGWPW